MVDSLAQSHNLPVQLTSFVGRQKELALLAELLNSAQARLLTLTGAGGSGKTRLALEAGRQAGQRFEDGVWFVELAPLTNPQLVVQQVAQVFGLAQQPELPLFTALVNYLKNRSLLLMLDNCEHLLEACASLCERLLKECPGLVILTTSRESLRIGGEYVIPVRPLGLPVQAELTSMPLDELAHAEAVQLFLERGRAVQPEFKLTEQNRAEITALCESLDGLPLALELAAARLRGLSVTQLAGRLKTLGSRFQLLNQGSRTALPRHQTLEALLQWSYVRLTEREQVVLRRVSVFAGGFSLSGAEMVCRGNFLSANGQGQIEPGEILDLLSELVNKSLLLPDETAGDQAEPRYRLLETIRQYSFEQATEAGESELLHKRHLEWYVAFAEKAEPHLQGPEQLEWLKRVEREHANCRVALEWALQNKATEEALRLGGALWRFWQARSYFEESRYWLEKILAQSQGQAIEPGIKARALEGAGVLFSLFDYPASLVYHEENLKLRRELGDKPGLTAALKDLGWLALHYNDFQRAKTFAGESLELARDQDDKAGIAAALFILAIVAFFEGEIEKSRQWCEECLELWRGLGDTGSTASALHQRGMVALRQQNYSGAREYLLESLDLNRQLDNKLGIANNLLFLVELGLAQPEQPQGLFYATRLLGWIAGFNSKLGVKMPPLARQSFDTSQETGRSRLDEATFQRLTEEGSALSLEQMLDLARQGGLSTEPELNETQPEGVEATNQAGVDQVDLAEKLTPREIEVLRLLVDGLTNARIADRLFVTSRTVNAHLTSIYAKLSVTTRGGAIRYALEHHLV